MKTFIGFNPLRSGQFVKLYSRSGHGFNFGFQSPKIGSVCEIILRSNAGGFK